MTNDVYPVPESAASRALIKEADYKRIYKESVENNEAFWAETAKRLDWITFPTKIKDVSFDRPDVHIRWFEDGVLNACYNCIDRHLESRGDQTAIIWEGDEPDTDKTLTYRELYEEVFMRQQGQLNVFDLVGVAPGPQNDGMNNE